MTSGAICGMKTTVLTVVALTCTSPQGGDREQNPHMEPKWPS